MKYRRGYKYQSAENETFIVPIDPFDDIKTEFIELSKNGVLVIRMGYAWDGASRPTLDTKNSMRGSLVHDALYQLMRHGHIGGNCREIADDFLYDVLVADGMSKVRAWIWWRCVRMAAGYAADPKNVKKVYEAP